MKLYYTGKVIWTNFNFGWLGRTRRCCGSRSANYWAPDLRLWIMDLKRGFYEKWEQVIKKLNTLFWKSVGWGSKVRLCLKVLADSHSSIFIPLLLSKNMHCYLLLRYNNNAHTLWNKVIPSKFNPCLKCYVSAAFPSHDRLAVEFRYCLKHICIETIQFRFLHYVNVSLSKWLLTPFCKQQHPMQPVTRHPLAVQRIVSKLSARWFTG